MKTEKKVKASSFAAAVAMAGSPLFDRLLSMLSQHSLVDLTSCIYSISEEGKKNTGYECRANKMESPIEHEKVITICFLERCGQNLSISSFT